MWVVLATLVTLLITLIVVFEKVFHNYWERRGISTPNGGLPLIGHLPKLVSGESWTYVQNAYNEFKAEKMFGFYELNKPSLFVCDLEIIKQVLVKEFDSFTDRRDFTVGNTEENSWVDEMISSLNGSTWKRLRSTVSPTFSSGKMKHMFPIVNHHAKNLIAHCETKMEKDKQVDVKKSYAFFTMDVIASTAFGIECSSLFKEDPIFARNAEKIFQTSPLYMLKLLFIFLLPRVSKALNIQAVDETWNFFKSVCTETLKERRESGVKRGDFLDLLLGEQEKQKTDFLENKDYSITDKTIVAQSVLFLVAGYDNISNALSVTTFFLAKHPEFQIKLREELKEIFDEDGNVEYHDLMEAKYLDACVSEALRLVPGGPALERKCTKEFKIPDSNYTIPVGMLVLIPLWGLHREPEFWKDPDEFVPDRFLPENKSKIVPFTYMPFGLGPRNCIAMRFALMVVKICLAQIIISNEVVFAPGFGEFKLENGGGAIRPAKGTIVVQLQKI